MGLKPHDYIPKYRGLEDNFPRDTDAYLIAVSGGKDSEMVLSLAVRLFPDKHIIPWHMYFLPGLDMTEDLAYRIKHKYGLKLHTLMHWATCGYLRRGTFRAAAEPDYPVVELADIERQIRSETGALWIGYGYKSCDSLERRGMMNSWPNGICQRRLVFAPLVDTSNSQVVEYCRVNHIYMPDNWAGKRTTGIDLSPGCLRWMKMRWPMDYQRVLRVFPFASSQADRADQADRITNNDNKI